jgi:tRNA 2-thiouridine synthesizing protein A
MDTPRDIDARGLRCPLPALRLARAVRDQGPGLYRLVADDPAAATDIPALAIERGWTLLSASPPEFIVRA